MNLLVFSDLDGCLLNHGDYSFQPALPALSRLQSLGVPLILASSKTEAEMHHWAEAIGNVETLICENGGVVVNGADRTMLGMPRDEVIAKLETLREQYSFRTFTDMGVEGITETTSLPKEQAIKSADRKTTEPLQWKDTDDKIDSFVAAVESQGLTCRRGGRFWHIAAPVDKGTGMAFVLESFNSNAKDKCQTVALGDSPIDIPMLEQSNYPIVIPNPHSSALMNVDHPRTMTANFPGPTGWNAAINCLLDELKL